MPEAKLWYFKRNPSRKNPKKRTPKKKSKAKNRKEFGGAIELINVLVFFFIR
jgi:hypothetical protein